MNTLSLLKKSVFVFVMFIASLAILSWICHLFISNDLINTIIVFPLSIVLTYSAYKYNFEI